MNLNELSPAAGSKHKAFRVGRGHGSGNGKTSGRGHKGQKARSGGGVRPGFEGGQMPIYRRLPKRGFTNVFAKQYTEINVSDLNGFENGAVVNAESLKNAGIIKKMNDGIVVMGRGDLTAQNLTIQAVKFTKTAAEKIAGAGGKAEVI